MHLVFLTPIAETPGGGSAFNAGLVPALRSLGHQVEHGAGIEEVPGGATPVIDGMLLPELEGAMEGLVARDAVAIIHHISAKAGRDAEVREAVRAVERRMLPRFRRVVATSAVVAARLSAEYGVAAPIVLQPGVADLPRNRSGGGAGTHLLSLGVLTPRKGHEPLLRALARLFDLDWSLTIAGDARRDPVHAGTIAALIETLGLTSRVELLTDPDDAALEAAWARADLFALASRWEGHPAAIVEALRRGIPVVAWKVEGVAAFVPQSAGMLCPPEDAATFSKTLRRAIFDLGLRAAFAEGAWQAGMALPGWPQQALAFQSILES